MTFPITQSRWDSVDINALCLLMHESIHGLAHNAYSAAQLNAWSPRPLTGTTARQRFSNQTIWIAEDESGLAAFMTLTPDAHLDFAYTHPRAAGKGAASAIYSALETHAHSFGVQAITSDISICARPFFETRGFRIIQEQRPVRHGVELINFHAKKVL